MYFIGKDESVREKLDSLYNFDVISLTVDLKLEMTLQEKRKLLMFLNHKTQAKSTLTRSVQIKNPDYSLSEQQKISMIGKSICRDILKAPSFNPEDLRMVMNTARGFYSIMDAEIISLA
jgi:hypothetical protein